MEDKNLTNSDGSLNLKEYYNLPVREKSGRLGVVIGDDTRTEVTNTQIAPYKSIVRLVMTFGEDKYRGTGFVVNKNVILTAGHNLYDHKLKIMANSVTIFIEGEKEKQAKKTQVTESFKLSDDDKNDWGLIKIDYDCDESAILPLKNVSELKEKDGLIAGYPAEVKNKSTIAMWEASGELKNESDKGVLSYTISTSGGNSGSPVMAEFDGVKNAVGIHVSGSETEKKNHAKAVDDEIISTVASF